MSDKKRNHPIGIFDSGLGGLTALREIRALLPGEALVYFGDTGRVPYGSRSHETICRYAEQDMHFLLTEAACKAVVVACGTVSANALERLRAQFDVPVIGVIEPAVDAAVKRTKNKRIGVIATPSSIASGAYERALRARDAALQVYSRACALFVPLVENGFVDADDPIPMLTAQRYLADLRDADIDTLILGCTHYPLLKPIIAKVLPGVTLIDTGIEAGNGLQALLRTYDLAAECAPGTEGSVRYFVSDEPQGFADAAARFLGHDKNDVLPIVRRVNIEAY